MTAQEKEIQDRDFRGGEIMTREMPQFTCSLQTVDIHYLCHEGEDRVRMQKKINDKGTNKKEGKINDKSPQGFPMATLFHSKMPNCIKNALLYLPQ